MQNRYNLDDRRHDAVIDHCEREGIAFVPYYPLRGDGGPEVAAAARRLGVPETTITAIREKHARDIPPEDAQIVEFTRELMRKHRVDDATFKALRARLGDDGLVQLTGVIGYYSMLSMTVNACELEAGQGAEVLQ